MIIIFVKRRLVLKNKKTRSVCRVKLLIVRKCPQNYCSSIRTIRKSRNENKREKSVCVFDVDVAGGQRRMALQTRGAQ